MASDVSRDLNSEPSNPAHARQEILYCVAALQVKIDVLRRAQTLAPQLAEELQATIDEIQNQLRILD